MLDVLPVGKIKKEVARGKFLGTQYMHGGGLPSGVVFGQEVSSFGNVKYTMYVRSAHPIFIGETGKCELIPNEMHAVGDPHASLDVMHAQALWRYTGYLGGLDAGSVMEQFSLPEYASPDDDMMYPENVGSVNGIDIYSIRLKSTENSDGAGTVSLAGFLDGELVFEYYVNVLGSFVAYLNSGMIVLRSDSGCRLRLHMDTLEPWGMSSKERLMVSDISGIRPVTLGESGYLDYYADYEFFVEDTVSGKAVPISLDL